MARRLILVVGVMAILLGGLGFVKFRQIESAVHASAFQPPPEAVTSVVTKREQWPSTMSVIGTMEAVHGVTVSADLPGTVARINFDAGKPVHEGDILVVLDTRQRSVNMAPLETHTVLARANMCGVT